MPKAFAVEATIDRPADQIWSALTDWPNAYLWMPGVDAMAASGPTEVGTELSFHARGKDRPALISALDPGRAITLRSVQGGVTADYRYTIEPAGDGRSQVHLDADCATTGLWSIVGPVLRMMMKRTDAGQLERLKAVVEAE